MKLKNYFLIGSVFSFLTLQATTQYYEFHRNMIDDLFACFLIVLSGISSALSVYFVNRFFVKKYVRRDTKDDQL
jgi:hypothetical protein